MFMASIDPIAALRLAGRVSSLGEPAVGGATRGVCFGAFALVAPEMGQVAAAWLGPHCR